MTNLVRMLLCFAGIHPIRNRQRLEPHGLFGWVWRCRACSRIYRGL